MAKHLDKKQSGKNHLFGVSDAKKRTLYNLSGSTHTPVNAKLGSGTYGSLSFL